MTGFRHGGVTSVNRTPTNLLEQSIHKFPIFIKGRIILNELNNAIRKRGLLNFA